MSWTCAWHAGSVASTFTSIAHTGITVASLDDALAFWVDVLGFTLERRFHLDGEFAEHVTGVTSAAISAAVVSSTGNRSSYWSTPHPQTGRSCGRDPATSAPYTSP